MTSPISARISDALCEAIQAQVDAGVFPSRSQAIAHYLQRGVDADRPGEQEPLGAAEIRAIVREELRRALAGIQIQATREPEPPANPKRAAMLKKVLR